MFVNRAKTKCSLRVISWSSVAAGVWSCSIVISLNEQTYCLEMALKSGRHCPKFAGHELFMKVFSTWHWFGAQIVRKPVSYDIFFFLMWITSFFFSFLSFSLDPPLNHVYLSSAGCHHLFWKYSTLPACWLVTGEVNHTPTLPIRGTCIHVDYKFHYFVRKCIEKKCLVFIWMDTLLKWKETNLNKMNARCQLKVHNVSTTEHFYD